MSRRCEKREALYCLEDQLVESGLTLEEASRIWAIAESPTDSETITLFRDLVSEVAERNRSAGYNDGYERTKEFAARAIAELPAPGPNGPGNGRFRHPSSE